MNATRLLAVNARSARALELCLQESGSRLSVTDALDAAIRQWAETQEEGGTPQETDHDGRGYRWKCLFLPRAHQRNVLVPPEQRLSEDALEELARAALAGQ